MSKTKPKFLITRPQPSASHLASRLQQAGYSTLCQPLFDYQPKDDIAKLKRSLNKDLTDSPPIYIFVSVAAVTFANQVIPIATWPKGQFIAIGNATQSALATAGIKQVITPTVHTSEGLLNLNVLQNVKGRSVVIIRGESGRELIAKQLTQQGAHVQYFESYQKCWFSLNYDIAEQWLNENIEGVIITSNALLESVVQLTKNSDNFWQNTCLWIVASERIAKRALELGLNNVICAYGASDEAILDSLRNLE